MPDGAQEVVGLPGGSASVCGTAVILKALHSVMSRCGYVQKQGKNTFHNYKYAGEGHLLEVLRPAMLEFGLLLIPSGKSRTQIDEHGNTFVDVEYTLAHKDGHVWPEKIVAYGAGNDRNSKGGVGDKGLYKALTGANKYLLFKLFQIETGDDPEPASVADEAPPMDQKNAPGISAARKEVDEQLRHVDACSDGDSLIGLLNAEETVNGKKTAPMKALAVRVCREYPGLWIGPEEFSGMKGRIEKAGNELLVAPTIANWLRKVEEAARKE